MGDSSEVNNFNRVLLIETVYPIDFSRLRSSLKHAYKKQDREK